MVKRVSALSQVLKETQPAPVQQEPITQEKQDDTITVKTQSGNTDIPQNRNSILAESGNTEIQKNGNTDIPQKRRKTDERIKLTFYLDPEDTQKFDALRYEYNVQHRQRLDQNKFMRLIIKHLDLSILESKNQ